MRKALIVGIDYYENFTPLRGCVNDAKTVAQILGRHYDGHENFRKPEVLIATGVHDRIDRDKLRTSIQALFSGKPDIALFYFAGHGFVDTTGGFVCASDCQKGHDGLALSEIMTFARSSKAANKIIILDSCHGGIVGDRPGGDQITEISHGMTLLTASTENQSAYEDSNGGYGIFTNLLVDALKGGAANLVGDVTPGSVYAHIDQSLGWVGCQRPVYKTNVEFFISLRKTEPPIALNELRQLATHFPEPSFEFKLDPAYEPERSKEQLDDPKIPAPDPAKNAIFKILQNYVKVNLVRPVGAPHMWHAAMGRKSCRLTTLGEHYRRLVADELI